MFLVWGWQTYLTASRLVMYSNLLLLGANTEVCFWTSIDLPIQGPPPMPFWLCWQTAYGPCLHSLLTALLGLLPLPSVYWWCKGPYLNHGFLQQLHRSPPLDGTWNPYYTWKNWTLWSKTLDLLNFMLEGINRTLPFSNWNSSTDVLFSAHGMVCKGQSHKLAVKTQTFYFCFCCWTWSSLSIQWI